MTEPDGKMPETEAQSVDVAVDVKAEDKFDEARAMETIHKLREAEKQGKKAAQELERYKKAEEERIKAELSETDRLKLELKVVQDKLEKTSIRTLQMEVAVEVGLPTALADRLKGETPEEMKADAKAILELMPKQKAAPNTGATAPGSNVQTGETDVEKRRRLFG